MKKIVALLLAAMMLLAMAACGNEPQPTPTPDPTPAVDNTVVDELYAAFDKSMAEQLGETPAPNGEKIGAVIISLSNQFWANMKTCYEAAAEKLGVAIDVQTGTTEGDTQSQLETLMTMADMDYSVIIVSPIDGTNLIPGIVKCNEKGIKVINAPGRLAVPVSEFTVGLIISEMKNIARSHQRMQNRNFDNHFSNAEYSVNLKGKNVGLVGCGMVGSRVARVMKALEANVLIYDPYMTDEKIREQGYTPVSLNDLCATSDVISIHYRLTPETKGLIGAEQFALMRPNCYLINTARAGLVDEAAMMDALQNHKIAGAGLDVFHEEPLTENNPLLTMENVTITNHMAGHCADIFQMTADIMMNALSHYLETGEWINVVNR